MKKYFLLIAVIALAITACTKEAGIGGGDKDPTDSTGTPGSGNGGNKADSVVTFKDIQFSLRPQSETYGRVFSSFKGKVYLDDAIPDSLGKYMDIGFNYYGAYMAFTSANDDNFDLKIPGALTTLVMNYVPKETMNVSVFDTIAHVSTLKTLKIATDDDSFQQSQLPVLVFFQNGFGKKGIIKVKSITGEYIVTDVKVMP